MWTISLISLCGLLVLCALGTFHEKYTDNLLQRFGMGGTAVSLMALIDHVWERGVGSNACVVLSASLFLYALGVALKVVHFSRPPTPPTTPSTPATPKA